MYALEALNVSKTYINHKALDDVSIQVAEKSIFGLLGPNGAGKTTLIRIINQISVMDEGRILLNGKNIKPSDTALIGYLPEERGLYKKMKVGEQAVYLAQLKGLKRVDAIKELKIWFEKFEIGSWWNKKVEELSKGMQQKVQFIATVMHRPKLLIFDEPFSGFDPINVNLLKQEILNLREEGATVIFSTHNMASVEELCDNIALVNKSKVILSGEINQVKEKFKPNIFKIEYNISGDLELENDKFEIVSSQQINGLKSSNIRLMNDANSSELIEKLNSQCEIKSFNEILPSINDIFISEVEGNDISTIY
ncbi:MAG: ABC transporter ATP-binding protein [Marinilabiliales bacterium]|nr:MAG: ABC transporter ATP-binding protein [Marinilabiliales bacterium]